MACVIANANRGKGRRPFKPSDFMPEFGGPKRQDPREMETQFRAWSAAHNKRIEAQRRKAGKAD